MLKVFEKQNDATLVIQEQEASTTGTQDSEKCYRILNTNSAFKKIFAFSDDNESAFEAEVITLHLPRERNESQASICERTFSIKSLMTMPEDFI